MSAEIYRDVVGYEGLYQVSNLGNVRNIHYRGGRIMKLGLTRGYYMVGLSKNGKRKNYTVHSLVAQSFLGHIPNGHEIVIDHANGIKTDNRLENLRLVTHRENVTFGTLKKETSSKYPGVSWHKNNKKWRALINIKNKLKFLGYFPSEIEAAEAYQKALEQHKKGLL